MIATHSTPNGVLRAAALAAHGARLCVLPAERDGDRKRVALHSWKSFQQRLPSDDEVDRWFRRHDGAMCIVCGAISGNLEMLDFDLGGEAFEPWRKSVDEIAPGLLGRLYIESTPAHGYHAAYRCESSVARNLKLAERRIEVESSEPVVIAMKEHKPRQEQSGAWVVTPVLVETRGEGGLFLCAPSDGYEVIQGDLCRLPVITAQEREILLGCARALDEAPKPSAAKPSPEAKAKPTSAKHEDLVSLLRRATAYLDALPPAISGQHGHDAAYAAATAMVHGFCLDRESALRLLVERYNVRCQPPWTEKELRHKVEDAATKPHELPYGWLRDAPRQVAPGRAHSDADCTPNGSVKSEGPSTETCATQDDAPACNDDAGFVPLGQRDPETGRLVLSAKRTLPTAEAFVREFHQHAEGRTIHAYGGVVMLWRDNRYQQVEDEWLKHRLQPWLHAALRYVYNKQTRSMELADFESNPTTVKQALETTRAYVHIPASIIAPSWLDTRTDRPPALEILPCKTLNVHIPTGRILAPTPALFTINALDFDYDLDAEPPERWIKFMEQLFGDDIESMEMLQEWMGYCLTSDTSQQKMLLLVGPRRSGKGTIGRILRRLVGEGNVVGPTTSSLAGNFGLQPLIGKSLAIVSDARFGGENMGIVVERLLCISGEDALTIDRKYLDSVSMKLPTRFMFLTNELPRLNDASTALAGRFLVLRLTQSFYGQEDPTLTDQLTAELPGILLWAIEGWKRLKARGRFVQPESVADAIRDLEDLASPVGAFVRDCCVVGPGHRIYVDPLYNAWKRWCEQDGRNLVTNKTTFGRDLVAAIASVKCRRDSYQNRFYDGIRLQEAQP